MSPASWLVWGSACFGFVVVKQVSACLGLPALLDLGCQVLVIMCSIAALVAMGGHCGGCPCFLPPSTLLFLGVGAALCCAWHPVTCMLGHAWHLPIGADHLLGYVEIL